MLGKNKVIARKTISFASGDNKTTEKRVTIVGADIYSACGEIPEGAEYIVNISKSASDTAGDLTLYFYRYSKTNGTNAENCLFQTAVIEKITGSSTNRSISVYYPFASSEETLVIGAVFGTNSSEVITIHIEIIKP